LGKKWKFEIFVKNRIFLSKNEFFGQKSKFLSKIEIFVKNRNFLKNQNFCQTSKLFSKIETFVKTRNFVKNWICSQKLNFFLKHQNINQKWKSVWAIKISLKNHSKFWSIFCYSKIKILTKKSKVWSNCLIVLIRKNKQPCPDSYNLYNMT